ncbi:MAG: hypothetical protein ACC651_11355 [Candidatus Scalindua sp.]
MKNITLTITITISVILSAILFMDYVENVSSDFSDYEEMQSSGIIERGWVPAYLPKSSKNISEHHNIDTNRVHISFDYDINEKLEIELLCTKIISNNKGKKYVCPPYSGATSILTLREDGTGFYKSEYDGLIH